jgi:triacylglycerol lipase
MTPVVLHHGLFGGDIKIASVGWSSFKGIDSAIAGLGYPLVSSAVHPTAGIAHRAAQLKACILANRPRIGDEPVILIAHSLGGLDARYMLDRLDMARHVAALVTVSTPHWGSPYADWCVRNIGHRLGAFRLMEWMGWDFQGILDVTTDRCARFNEVIRDVPGVRYYSVSAARPWHKVPPFALHAHSLVQKAEGPNDSLVSVKSATWGTHLATWPADHWHTINRRYIIETKHPTGDIAPYYLKILHAVQNQATLAPASAA